MHLLKPDFQDDKNPQTLIRDALELTATTSRWVYRGADIKDTNDKMTYDQLYNKTIQKRIDANLKRQEDFEEKDGFKADVATLVKTNYSTSQYNVDFKHLKKQRREHRMFKNTSQTFSKHLKQTKILKTTKYD